MSVVFVDVNTKWKQLKKDYKDKLTPTKKVPTSEKFVSFFRHSLLPRTLCTKFPYVIENTKKEYLTGRFRYFLTPKNRFVIKILMRGFFCIYLALLYIYREVDETVHTLRIPQLHDITIFNYFNNNYFNVFYFNSKSIRRIVNSYFLDFNFCNTYINYFNLYIFYHLKILNVILNFEEFKYEEDYYWSINNPQMLLIKNKKAPRVASKMKTDYFHYIKRKNRIRFFDKYIKLWPWYRDAPWNQREKGEDDEEGITLKRNKKNLKDHLMLQDNIFNFFIIYEFSLNLNKHFLFNYFNADFFNKVKIFIKKPVIKFYKYPHFLKSLYYTYNVEILKNKKKKPFLYTNYMDYNNNNIKNYNKTFDPTKHILDIKYFGIKMPFLFFLLYTWYCIYFRRIKYNLYVKGDLFFQEHFSKLYYFVWFNGGDKSGSNKHKFSNYKYHKLFTIYHLKTYVEVNRFNNMFFFYSSYHIKFKEYLNLNEHQHKSSFLFLLNNEYIFNVLELDKKKDYKRIYLSFFYNYFINYHYWYELLNGYILFMQTPVTRFDNEFKLGRLNYWQFDRMAERVFTLPLDKKNLLKYLQKKILFEHFFLVYLKLDYLNFYFLKDLNNLKILDEYKQYRKIVHFYDKIFHVMFVVIDPYFFKYYWKRCFPRKWHKIWCIQHYIVANILMTKHKVINFDIPKYNSLMNFFYWKIDSSNFFIVNNFKSLTMEYDIITINYIYKMRFLELIKQINFILKKKYFNNSKYFFSYYLSVLKNYYFDLLYYNIEYNFIFFFLNKKKYINLLYNYKINYLKNFIYSTFIYRYYIYHVLLENHFYDNWFHDWDKRIFWIYKEFLNHEGPLFYNKKTFVIKNH